MHRRHVYEDTTRVAVFIGGEFGIFTTDPHRLGEFARDLLASGRQFAGLLRESLERVAQW